VAAGSRAVRFLGRGIVVDLEGTLISRSYVADVLWPFAKRNLAGYLRGHWFDSAVDRIRDDIARHAGAASFAAWTRLDTRSAEAFVKLFDEVVRLYALPVRPRPLVELVSLVWCEGYRNSSLSTYVYPDVTAALGVWTLAGRDVRTFSSVLVSGQCAMLAKTEQGNLLGHFRDHYDGELGPKAAPGSFYAISDEMRLQPTSILYVSDDPPELDGARIAGYATAFIARPGNPPPPVGMRHPVITDLRAIHIT
jgi:enolase-phosphatase E1